QPFQQFTVDVFGMTVPKQGIVALLWGNQTAMPAPGSVKQHIEFRRGPKGLLSCPPERDLRPIVVAGPKLRITAGIGVLRLAVRIDLQSGKILRIEAIVRRAVEQFFGL